MVEEEGLEGSFERGDTGILSYDWVQIHMHISSRDWRSETEVHVHRHEILEVGVWEL